MTLITSGNHSEVISFLLVDSPLAPVVLGHPWLTRHNPHIDWHSNTVLSWSEHCHAVYLVSACSSVSSSVFQGEPVDLSNVPKEYLDLKEVFSKSRAASLPPHRPYDCAIDLLPGKSPPKGKLYSHSDPEREAMEKYISDSLATGLIRPSSSPEGARFFFCGEKGRISAAVYGLSGVEQHHGKEYVSLAADVFSLRMAAGGIFLHQTGPAQRLPFGSYKGGG